MDVTLRNFFGKINALFLSLLPVIMVYKTPGLEIGLSTFLIIVFSINALLFNVFYFSFAYVKKVLPIALFLVYVATRNIGFDVFMPIIIILFILAFSAGAAECSFLKKIIEMVSCVASFCLLIQVVVHAFSYVHIPMIGNNLLLDSLKVYEHSINTGYSEVSQMYRPSAFFLEPSHFAQYCIVGLGLSLYENNKMRSFFISLGILLTTSGLGFVLVFAIWSWWYLSNNGVRSLQVHAKKIIALLMVIPPLLFLLSNTSFFKKVISRFLTTESSGGYNAIDGRLFWWNKYFGQLSWNDLIVGYGADQLPDCYFTGFMSVLYAYGIIGVFLLLLSYIFLAVKSDRLIRFLSVMYIGLFFVSNLTNMINLIFTFGVIFTLLFYENNFIHKNLWEKNV